MSIMMAQGEVRKTPIKNQSPHFRTRTEKMFRSPASHIPLKNPPKHSLSKSLSSAPFFANRA